MSDDLDRIMETAKEATAADADGITHCVIVYPHEAGVTWLPTVLMAKGEPEHDVLRAGLRDYIETKLAEVH